MQKRTSSFVGSSFRVGSVQNPRQEMLRNLTSDYDYLAHPGLMTRTAVQAAGQGEVCGVRTRYNGYFDRSI